MWTLEIRFLESTYRQINRELAKGGTPASDKGFNDIPVYSISVF